MSLGTSLNINSLQNEFEEAVEIIRKSRVQIMFLVETIIDGSYPDSQFDIRGYHLHRNNRKKLGGGILEYVSSDLISRILRLAKRCTCIEANVLEVKFKTRSIVAIGLYRSPSQRFNIK